MTSSLILGLSAVVSLALPGNFELPSENWRLVEDTAVYHEFSGVGFPAQVGEFTLAECQDLPSSLYSGACTYLTREDDPEGGSSMLMLRHKFEFPGKSVDEAALFLLNSTVAPSGEQTKGIEFELRLGMLTQTVKAAIFEHDAQPHMMLSSYYGDYVVVAIGKSPEAFTMSKMAGRLSKLLLNLDWPDPQSTAD